jgi:hypothetical protein
MHLLCSVKSDPDSLPALVPIKFFNYNIPGLFAATLLLPPEQEFMIPMPD